MSSMLCHSVGLLGLKLNAPHQAHQATKVQKSTLGQHLLSKLNEGHLQKDSTTCRKDFKRLGTVEFEFHTFEA